MMPDDRIPPSNLEAERGVLGAILLDQGGAALLDVAPLLKVEDFYRDSHQLLYRAIRDLADAGKPIDSIAVADELRRRGHYLRVGGDDALVEILGSVPHAANAAYHAQMVRQKAIVRRLIQDAQETLRAGYANEETADEQLEAATRRVLAVGELAATSDPQRLVHFAEQAMDRIGRRGQGEVSGIATGLVEYDSLADGLPDGSLVILGARPSVGKTAWSLSVCEHAALHGGISTLFVSLEMAGQELAERLLVSRSRVDGHRVRTGRGLTGANEAALSAALDSVRPARLWIDELAFQTVGQIAATARRYRAREAIGLLVVDYLQLVEPEAEDRKKPRHEQMAKVSRRLKALAKDLSIPVLALCQLNRQAEARDDRKPRMADLRESGSLEQDADLVLLLHRPEVYDPNDRPGEADLIVAKNRNGRTGTVRLTYRKEVARFENYSPYGDPIDVQVEPF